VAAGGAATAVDVTVGVGATAVDVTVARAIVDRVPRVAVQARPQPPRVPRKDLRQRSSRG
jgi:hypothetical protein